MSKDAQGAIKDVGGFVAGSLNGERRKKENVISRSMLTLDLDFVTIPAADLWDEIDTSLERWFIRRTHIHRKNRACD